MRRARPLEGFAHGGERRLAAPPELEGGRALPQEHLASVHGGDAARPGGIGKRRPGRSVHHVHDGPDPPEALEVDRERIVRAQPEGGRVQHQVEGLPLQGSRIGDHVHPRVPDFGGHGPGASKRPVDHLDLGGIFVDEGGDGGACTAPGARQQDARSPGWPRQQGADGAPCPLHVGVVPADARPLAPEGVARARPPDGFGRLVQRGRRAPLVRHRHVAAATGPSQRAHHRGDILGLTGDRHIPAVESGGAERGGLDHGRERVRHRVPQDGEDARAGGRGRDRHGVPSALTAVLPASGRPPGLTRPFRVQDGRGPPRPAVPVARRCRGSGHRFRRRDLGHHPRRHRRMQ